jgi:hypothetical protein
MGKNIHKFILKSGTEGLLKNPTWYLLMWDKETFMNQRK